MPRIVRIVPVVLLVLASRAAVAQEPPDSARAFSEAQRSISPFGADPHSPTPLSPPPPA